VTRGDLTSTNSWRYGYGADDWFVSNLATETTKRHIRYCNTNNLEIAAIGLAWAGEMVSSLAGGVDPAFGTRWGGTSEGGADGNRSWGLDTNDYALTGNRISMDTYIRATQEYSDYCKSNGFATKVFFTTGSVEGWDNTKESGYQRHLKHEYIRNYVAATADGILFDYADILCWSDAGNLATTDWSGNGTPRTFPVIHPDNMLDLDGTYVEDGDRIGERGALRLAKAMWWMLARISGWNPDSQMSPSSQDVNASAESPRMSGVEIGNGYFGFTFPSQSGLTYVIEWKDTLGDPEWTTLTNMVGTGSSVLVKDYDALRASRFYRVRSP